MQQQQQQQQQQLQQQIQIQQPQFIQNGQPPQGAVQVVQNGQPMMVQNIVQVGKVFYSVFFDNLIKHVQVRLFKVLSFLDNQCRGRTYLHGPANANATPTPTAATPASTYDSLASSICFGSCWYDNTGPIPSSPPNPSTATCITAGYINANPTALATSTTSHTRDTPGDSSPAATYTTTIESAGKMS